MRNVVFVHRKDYGLYLKYQLDALLYMHVPTCSFFKGMSVRHCARALLFSYGKFTTNNNKNIVTHLLKGFP